MNTAKWVLRVLLAIALAMIAQMKLAVAFFPQTASREPGR